MGRNERRVERLEQASGSEDFSFYAVFPENGEPYIRTRQGRKAGLNDFPGAVVKAYLNGLCSPDSWNVMEGDE